MKHKIIIAALVFCLIPASLAFGEDNPNIGSDTGLPIPRFVSLKSSEVNARVGPGERYPIRWVYTKRSMPVKVINEYDNWRKVEDIEGGQAWVHKHLIRPVSAAITRSNAEIVDKGIFQDKVAFTAEKGVLLEVVNCNQYECLVRKDGNPGYIERKLLWGINSFEVK